MVPTDAIIKRIEMRLSEIGMSKADFYKQSGIFSATFSQWLTGLYRPSDKKLAKAAEVLGVSLTDLCDGGYESCFWIVFQSLCQKKGVSLSRAAISAGISKSLLSKWKSNNTSVPSTDVLKKLSNYFNVPVDYLINPSSVKSIDEMELEVVSILKRVPTEKRKEFLYVISDNADLM